MTASFLPANTTATPVWLARRAELVAAAQAMLPGLRAHAAEAETSRTIPEATIRALHETGLFRVLQPARWGGPELDFGIYVEVGAILGSECASSGWVWANLVSHHWMLAYWPEAAQRQLWEIDRDMLIGSAFVFPCGRAQKVDGGYRLKGRWPFSSGINHCSWLMVGAMVAGDSGAPPEARMFLVPPSDYTVIDTWHVSGLRGTGSHDVAVKDAVVPEPLTLAAIATRDGSAPGSKVNKAPIFQVPMFAVFAYAISGIVLGIAEGAVARYIAALKTKTATYTGSRLAELAPLQLKIAEAGACCDAARALLAKDCAEITERAERGLDTDMEQRAIYRRNPAFARPAVRARGRSAVHRGRRRRHLRHQPDSAGVSRHPRRHRAYLAGVGCCRLDLRPGRARPLGRQPDDLTLRPASRAGCGRAGATAPNSASRRFARPTRSGRPAGGGARPRSRAVRPRHA
ncbi:MAG: acyl-CoA dehydrogenase family protein [Pseudomonadota bacterium]